MTPASLVKVRGLACGHAGKAVVSDIDLDLAPGGLVVLLGPNGSGKSTFLKTLAGTLSPVAGEVAVEGQALTSLSARERAKRIAYVPQEEEPQYAFSVRETVIMGRLPYADKLFDTPDDIDAAQTAMRQAGCLELAERTITELSGGELQRVLMARALAQHPKVLLLDEPTSHLDVHFALDMVKLLKDLAESGLAVVAAIHDLNLAARLGGEALLIGDGKVQARGPIRTVLSSPELDRTFRVAFRRMESEGELLLVPHALT